LQIYMSFWPLPLIVSPPSVVGSLSLLSRQVTPLSCQESPFPLTDLRLCLGFSFFLPLSPLTAKRFPLPPSSPFACALNLFLSIAIKTFLPSLYSAPSRSFPRRVALSFSLEGASIRFSLPFGQHPPPFLEEKRWR